MISVSFRTKSSAVLDRRFAKGDGVSIYGKVSGVSGLGAILTGVRLEVPELSYFEDSQTNLFGDYAFYYVFPNADQALTIKITATFSVSGQETVTIPVSVGAMLPAKLPTPPKSDTSFIQDTTRLITILVVVGIFIFAYPYIMPIFGGRKVSP